MRVRDAVEADAAALGELARAPPEVMRNVVHDRTVRVAEREAGTEGNGADDAEEGDEADGTDGHDPETGDDTDPNTGDDTDPNTGDDTDVVGFVGFDATVDAVRVTYLRGTRAARERLLDEPIRFARKEGMIVEVLVPEGESETAEVVERAGFDRAGTGPRFGGDRTVEYRLDPAL